MDVRGLFLKHIPFLIKAFSGPLLPRRHSPVPLTCHQLPLGDLTPLHFSTPLTSPFTTLPCVLLWGAPERASSPIVCASVHPLSGFSSPLLFGFLLMCFTSASFTQHMCIDHLLWARHFAQCWGSCAANVPISMVLRASWERWTNTENKLSR